METFYKKPTSAGFTLIELLVVIAIIGILSAVVLASLNDARDAARDSAIKQQVKNYATMLELERAQNGRFLNHQTNWIGNSTNPDCAAETYYGTLAEDFRALCQGIYNQISLPSGNMLYVGTVTGGQTFSIMARLNDGNWYCQGSSGRTYEGPTTPPGGQSWDGSGCYRNP